MKKLLFLALSFVAVSAFAQGYKPGDKARDFSLKNVDGKNVSLADYTNAKGFIVIFTCNHCPYAVAYQDRINALNVKYAVLDYPVIAINPNDSTAIPIDSYSNMQARAKEKGFTFPYLVDGTQEIAKTYGAAHTPHAYVLQKVNGALIVKYIGAIDDNTYNESAVKQKYVELAVDALLAGKDVTISFTKAIGCTIKWK